MVSRELPPPPPSPAERADGLSQLECELECDLEPRPRPSTSTVDLDRRPSTVDLDPRPSISILDLDPRPRSSTSILDLDLDLDCAHDEGSLGVLVPAGLALRSQDRFVSLGARGLARSGSSLRFVRTPTMQDNQLPFQKLDSYVVAKEIAELVHLSKIRDTELRDQATRASKSCFLQLCEGLPNDGVAMRRKYFVEANNSLHETVGAVDLAATLGMMSMEQANAIQALAVRLKAMLWRLQR